MAKTDRRKAEENGRRAEWLAEIVLRIKGYRILARRARTPLGEMDIVARKGSVIVIIEVKQRQTLIDGQNAVPDAAWRRIARAADLWLATKHPSAFDMDRRFDLVIALPRLRIRHLKDVWRPDSALTRG